MALVEQKNALVVVTKNWVEGSTFGSTWETGLAGHLFVADAPYQVVSVTERHSVVGSTTVMLVGALGSTPMGSGTNLLSSTIDLAGTVDLARSGVLLGSAVLSGSTVLGTTATGPVLSTGDALSLRYTAANLPPIGVLTVILQKL